jgi:hypothetical protein
VSATVLTLLWIPGLLTMGRLVSPRCPALACPRHRATRRRMCVGLRAMSAILQVSLPSMPPTLLCLLQGHFLSVSCAALAEPRSDAVAEPSARTCAHSRTRACSHSRAPEGQSPAFLWPRHARTPTRDAGAAQETAPLSRLHRPELSPTAPPCLASSCPSGRTHARAPTRPTCCTLVPSHSA